MNEIEWNILISYRNWFEKAQFWVEIQELKQHQRHEMNRIGKEVQGSLFGDPATATGGN